MPGLYSPDPTWLHTLKQSLDHPTQCVLASPSQRQSRRMAWISCYRPPLICCQRCSWWTRSHFPQSSGHYELFLAGRAGVLGVGAGCYESAWWWCWQSVKICDWLWHVLPQSFKRREIQNSKKICYRMCSNCGNLGQKSVLTNKDVAEWLCRQNPLGWKLKLRPFKWLLLSFVAFFFWLWNIWSS